ncbi:MAG: terminase family protein [Acidobacteriia bacterium]|nr:terminase family protein [Terriglobia bacterium]
MPGKLAIRVTGPELPNPNFRLYPYQARWIQDHSRLKIACKSRRIGYSFAAGFRALRSCLEWKHNVIVLSKKEELAKEFISEAVAPHVRAIGILADYHQGYIPQTSIYKQECQLSNGSRIIALTANPDSARSYEGDVLLDEFAFHLDARKVYEAIEPSITRGYSLEVISTPNGQQGEYYKLAKAAGLVDDLGVPNCEWSAHKTDINQAIAQGCRDRYGKPLRIEAVRAGCLDDEMWLQEYCCQFLSVASQWIPPELFEKNTGAPVGTTVEVADLLYNVPARLKFLKGEATEASHITELVAKLAMAYPRLHVRLRHNGRTALDAAPDRDGFSRAQALLGPRIAARMVPVAGEESGVRVTAYLGAPELAQATARGVQLFVGRRPVRDRGLLHALAMGYGELIARGRYPVAIVLLDVPAGAVDVNVHPQKLEVRFSDPAAVAAAVCTS